MNIFKKTRKFLSALRDLASWREKDFRKAGVDNRHAAERAVELEKLSRGKLLEQIGSKLGLKYPLENRECILMRIEQNQVKLDAVRHALRVIEGLTHSHTTSITDINRIHKLADDGLNAIKK